MIKAGISPEEAEKVSNCLTNNDQNIKFGALNNSHINNHLAKSLGFPEISTLVGLVTQKFGKERTRWMDLDILHLLSIYHNQPTITETDNETRRLQRIQKFIQNAQHHEKLNQKTFFHKQKSQKPQNNQQDNRKTERLSEIRQNCLENARFTLSNPPKTKSLGTVALELNSGKVPERRYF